MEDEVLENHDCVTLRHELERSAKKRMIVMRQKDMGEFS